MTSFSIIIIVIYGHTHIDTLEQFWWLKDPSSHHNKIYHNTISAFCFCCYFWDKVLPCTLIEPKLASVLSHPGPSSWVDMVPGLYHHSRLPFSNAIHIHLEENHQSLYQPPKAPRDGPTTGLFSWQTPHLVVQWVPPADFISKLSLSRFPSLDAVWVPL